MFLTDSKVGLGTPWRRIGNAVRWCFAVSQALPRLRYYSVFNGFEGRVRHTLASHWEPSGHTPLDSKVG